MEKRMKEMLSGASVALDEATICTLCKSLAKPGAVLVENSESVVEAFAYSGYDPIFTLREFLKLSTTAQDMQGSFDLGGWKLPKATSFLEDLRFFAFTFMLRGASVYRILDKSEQDYKNALKHKCGQYGISMSRPTGRKQTMPKTKMTIPRIAATVPHWCLQLISAGLAEPVVGNTILGVEVKARAVCHPLFASLCFSDRLLPLCFTVSQMLAEVINDSKHHSQKSEIERFVRASYNSKLFSVSHRTEICKALGIVVVEGTSLVLESTVERALKKAKAHWATKVKSSGASASTSATEESEEEGEDA